MPAFLPFTGLRYSRSHIARLEDVVCPPYDVISEQERVDLASRSPYNAVHIELPVAEGESGDPYIEAAIQLDAWRDAGILRRDPEPCFYGFQSTYRGEEGTELSTLGVIGALGLDGPGSGLLPHEETTSKAKLDRLRLLRGLNLNTSPIWTLSTATGLSELLHPPARPIESVVGDDGSVQQMWPIPDEQARKAISAAVEKEPVLIADGHHRYETALTYQDECRDASGAGHDFIMALVVELSEQQVSIGAIHRLVSGLPDGTDVLELASPDWRVEPYRGDTARVEEAMQAEESLAMIIRGGIWMLYPDASSIPSSEETDSGRILPLLESLPAHSLVYQHGVDNCVAAVSSGEADVAILLRPATVGQIARVGSGGTRLPAKTTFFWPKPLTGLVFREL